MNANPTIKRILFATDFLASSRLALDYAAAFAHHFKAVLVMLHVLELSSAAREAETQTAQPCLSRKSAQERLGAIASGVRRPGLEVETFVEEGVPSDVVLQAVDRHSADLLVLGIHGVHRGIEHLLIGSNTEEILLSANCPTMTVGAHVMAGLDLGLHLEKILYFSDFTPEAVAAAPYALFLSREFRAPIDVCQLLPVAAESNPKLRQDLADEYCEWMRRALPEAGPDWLEPAFYLDHGMELDEMIDRAQRVNAGLIVLGARAQSQFRRRLHTSFVYQLLAKATCPVVSIRYRDP
jgi:nucleotide-binding universal stress UspA family protein